MQFTDKINQAIKKSAKLHLSQRRKGDVDLPYATHPFAVAWIVSEHCEHENAVVAALLHDVLEDVPSYTAEDMQRDFGDEVTRLVLGVTEDKSITDWKKRKQGYLQNLNSAPKKSVLISAADKIHNMHSLLETHAQIGDKLWDSFNSPPQEQLWFFEQVYELIDQQLDNKIVDEYAACLHKLQQLVEQ